MSATYSVRWTSAEGTAHGSAEADNREDADDLAAEAAGMWPLVSVHDGWMEIARFESGAGVKARHEAAGHPVGCACGECEVRAAHVAGEHAGRVCGHEICRKCWKCPECDWAEDRQAALRELIGEIAGWDGELEAIRVAAGRAQATLSRMQAEGDEELAGDAGDDAFGEFAAIARAIRNLKRIARVRMTGAEAEASCG